MFKKKIRVTCERVTERRRAGQGRQTSVDGGGGQVVQWGCGTAVTWQRGAPTPQPTHTRNRQASPQRDMEEKNTEKERENTKKRKSHVSEGGGLGTDSSMLMMSSERDSWLKEPATERKGRCTWQGRGNNSKS